MRVALSVVAVTAVLVVTGCTTTTEHPESTPTATTAHEPTVAATAQTFMERLPLSGEFVSQGAETAGTVTITTTSDTEFTITLSQFSTGPGDDLRLWLSEGELTRGSDGFYFVDGDSQLELAGTIDPNDSEQSFVFSSMPLDEWDVRSLTVYDYPNRVALGSAALE